MKEREYQDNAIAAIQKHWRNGRSVCLVGPTGCGKTRIGWSAIQRADEVLWVIHRTDLRRQTTSALRKMFDASIGEGQGRERVAVLLPGKTKVRRAPVTVASIQTLLEASGVKALDGRRFRYLVLDEAAHFRASQWERVRDQYGTSAFRLGMTAFPQRSDGRALGHMFDELVVAANYSELVRQGFLVPCRLYRPDESLGRNYAQDPVDSWLEYSEGAKTFAFVPSIDAATELANRFRAAGIFADTVTANDPEPKRVDTIKSFRDPSGVRILVSVDALTEGIDEPIARCALLARAFRFEGSYIQAVGRVLRPHDGKRDAIVIDLVGASALHGGPTADRAYSLEGDDDAEKKGGSGSGGHRGDNEPKAPEVLNRRLMLAERGALKQDESPQPVSRGEPIEAIRVTKDLAPPRVTRATPAARLFGARM